MHVPRANNMALTTETKFSTTLAKIVAGTISVCVVVWALRGYVADQKEAQNAMLSELRDIKKEISAINTDAVTQHQFEAWSNDLRWENRGKEIIVPNPKNYVNK